MDLQESRGSASRGVSTAYPSPPPPKQGRMIIALFGAFVFFFIFFTTPAVKEVEHVAHKAVEHIPGGDKLPSLSRYNPFKQAAHQPPVYPNSSSGDTKWYSDWKWLNPFSSTITLDDTRSVLPPLQQRPYIYTYYDTETQKDPLIQEEEARLLLIWRRAWWAQGFKPVILGTAEAMKNPHYETFLRTRGGVPFASEVLRWLAWGHMGSGILANWLVLPMAARNSHDLVHLRRGHYPKDEDGNFKIKRYETLTNGIFWGSKEAIDNAITTILKEPRLEDKQSLLEAIGDGRVFTVEPKPLGIAFYEPSVLASQYKSIADKLVDAKPEALKMLSDLITSHLHATFLSTFSDGFDILTTRPHDTTLLAAPGVILANSLNECPQSPIPQSCPPNNVDCRPCESIKIKYPTAISNSTNTFTIGTIPHPYTLAILMKGKQDLTVPYVRRHTTRDPWLEKATEDTLKSNISAYSRILYFKENIVSDLGQTLGIWHTAERDWVWEDLEWRFGFTLSNHNATEAIELPEPSLENYPKVLSKLLASLEDEPSRKEVVGQGNLITWSKNTLRDDQKPKKGEPDMRRVVEAWHLADTEAWRFVRAFEARARMERAQWEEDEKIFVKEVESKID